MYYYTHIVHTVTIANQQYTLIGLEIINYKRHARTNLYILNSKIKSLGGSTQKVHNCEDILSKMS